MATRLGDLVRHLPARMRIEGTAKQSIETARHRLVITGVLFTLAFTIVALRLVDVTILKEGHEPRVVHLPKSELQTERADIVDRNGVLLATSLATGSLYANPKLVLDPAEAAAKLARARAIATISFTGMTMPVRFDRCVTSSIFRFAGAAFNCCS
jgi:cell division protein FtsI/penicillin-binding protein 2